MTIRLGANPIIWSNDDMRELGAETSLETCLSEARDIGFEGMELGHKFPLEPQALAAALRPFGLQCVSGWYSANLLERDVREELTYLRPHLELLQALGSSVLVLAEVTGAVHGDRSCALSKRPILKDSQWAQFGRRLTQLAEATAAQGLRVAYHHHMGTVVQSAADIDRLMQSTGPAVGLLLDTGHARFAEADPVALARSYASRISHLHAKDVRAQVCARALSGDLSFLEAVVQGVFTVPGDGCVSFAEVFAALPAYSGWVILEAEQDPRIANPHTYASLGYQNLKQLLSGRMS